MVNPPGPPFPHYLFLLEPLDDFEPLDFDPQPFRKSGDATIATSTMIFTIFDFTNPHWATA